MRLLEWHSWSCCWYIRAWGTCWGGYLRQVSDRFPEIRSDLGVPEGNHVRCALMVGYAKGEKYPNPVWRPKTEALWLED